MQQYGQSHYMYQSAGQSSSRPMPMLTRLNMVVLHCCSGRESIHAFDCSPTARHRDFYKAESRQSQSTEV